MPFISEKNKAAAQGGGGGYLNPSKIQPGTSVRFALLDDQPLEFFECWGEDANGNSKPFRFEEDPSPEEIREEMGEEYSRRMNRDGNGPEKVKFSVAVPVFNYDSEKVEVLPLTQKTLINELDSISQMEDYAELLDWDFVLGKEGTGLETKYSLRAAPRKKGCQSIIEEAWSESRSSGFDITRMVSGGNPFKKD